MPRPAQQINDGDVTKTINNSKEVKLMLEYLA